MNSSKQSQRARHSVRINHAIDLIESAIDTPLTLAQLAAAACYSPFHFHRIFAELTGLSCHDFIRRRRLTRSANRLVAERNVPIGQLAMEMGFHSAANFARAFRQQFGMNPSHWRNGGSAAIEDLALESIAAMQRGMTTELLAEPPLTVSDQIEVAVLPPQRVAYMRCHGLSGWALAAHWQQVFECYEQAPFAGVQRQWIGACHGFSSLCGVKFSLYDSCVPISEASHPQGNWNTRTLEGGRFAILPFSGNPHAAALHYLRTWLPESSWIREDRESREHFMVQEGVPKGFLCLPVRANLRA